MKPGTLDRNLEFTSLLQQKGNREPMKIAERRVGANIVLEVLETRLGADKVVAFKEAVGRYLEDGAASIVLDLSSLEFIDSSGLGAILSILKRMPQGCELIICGTTEPVASMFKLTRLDRIFTMRKNVDEVVSTLSV
jgi:anti-sigma B factor antagonist